MTDEEWYPYKALARKSLVTWKLNKEKGGETGEEEGGK